MEQIRQELKTKVDKIKNKLDDKKEEMSREEMQVLLFNLLLEEEQNAGN